MKTLRIFSLFAFAAMLSMVACKNASVSGDEPQEKLATTSNVPNTNTPATTPNASNETPAPMGPLTSISFDESSYDFGEVMEGEKVVHVYKFKNTGDEPLVISNAKGSCGCTVPDWPKEPIPAGSSGEIKVQFDTKGKGAVEGRAQSKRVTITANTDPVNTYLTIKGKVLKEEGAEAAPAGK